MGELKRDEELKQFRVAPDKSGIYLYRNESIGAIAKMYVELDGALIGQTAAMTYLYKEVSPGKHTVTSHAENSDSIEVETIAGRLYYLWQEVKMGMFTPRTKLHLVSDEEGRRGVLESKYAETR